MTLRQHVQNQDPDTEAAKWNSASFILLFTPVVFLFCHGKMFAVK